MNSASFQNLFLLITVNKCKIKLSTKFKNFSNFFFTTIIINFILIQVHYFRLILILFQNCFFLCFAAKLLYCLISNQLQKQKCFIRKKLFSEFKVNCQLIRRFSNINLLCIFQVKSNLLANGSKNLYIFLTYLVIFQSH